MNRTLLVALSLVTSIGPAQTAPKRISLDEAIRIAEQNNPMIGVSKADLEVARSGAKAAKAGVLPQLSANGFATGGNNPGIIGASPMSAQPTWMLFPTGGFLDGNLALMIPIFAPKAQGMANSASWQAKAAMADLNEVRADIALQVTDAFERVLLARQMIVAEQAKVNASEELVRTTQALFDAGKGIQASVERSRAELSHAQRALTSSRNDEAKALLDLEAAMNVDMGTPLDPDGALDKVSPPTDLSQSIINAKSNRGILLAARARQIAAASDIHAAEGQRKPQVYGAVMGDATNRSDMGGMSAGLTVSFPLFDGGRINAEVSQARSARTKAQLTLRQAEITVEKEVRQAWLDVETAQANLLSAEAAVKAAQAAYDVTVVRVSAGKSILVEQLDALEALTRAKSDLAQSTFDEILATAKLNRAEGGHK